MSALEFDLGGLFSARLLYEGLAGVSGAKRTTPEIR